MMPLASAPAGAAAQARCMHQEARSDKLCSSNQHHCIATWHVALLLLATRAHTLPCARAPHRLPTWDARHARVLCRHLLSSHLLLFSSRRLSGRGLCSGCVLLGSGRLHHFFFRHSRLLKSSRRLLAGGLLNLHLRRLRHLRRGGWARQVLETQLAGRAWHAWHCVRNGRHGQGQAGQLQGRLLASW